MEREENYREIELHALESYHERACCPSSRLAVE
jgi:hypothetical protein